MIFQRLAVLCVLCGSALAVTMPVEGGTGFELVVFDYGVIGMLRGPIGFVFGVAAFLWGIIAGVQASGSGKAMAITRSGVMLMKVDILVGNISVTLF